MRPFVLFHLYAFCFATLALAESPETWSYTDEGGEDAVNPSAFSGGDHSLAVLCSGDLFSIRYLGPGSPADGFSAREGQILFVFPEETVSGYYMEEYWDGAHTTYVPDFFYSHPIFYNLMSAESVEVISDAATAENVSLAGAREAMLKMFSACDEDEREIDWELFLHFADKRPLQDG